jgi:hypothetical protein
VIDGIWSAPVTQDYWLKHSTGAPMTLEQVIEGIRPMVENSSRPTKERIRALWAAAKMARKLDAADPILRAFMQLAAETNLIDRCGRWTGADVAEEVRRYGAVDVAHVIRWALRGWNPFEQGPLK